MLKSCAFVIVETNKHGLDDTESKIEKAIKAAEAVGLTMCKLPSYEQKEVEVKEEMPTIQDRNVLDELNLDSFVPKQFTSTRSKKIPDNIVIDLDAGTVKVPDVELPQVDSMFHPDVRFLIYSRNAQQSELTHSPKNIQVWSLQSPQNFIF